MAKAKEKKEEADLAYGDLVAMPWGTGEIEGTVHEVYDGATGKHVVLILTPESSGLLVDEPTTVALPIEDVRKIASAA